MDRQILFEWPDLQITAKATLAFDQNPDLCTEVWNALPLESIQSHAIVTGESMYAWVPMLSFANIPVKERIDQAPIGRVRYSQNTGNKIIIQYGPCTEDILGAVLGMIHDEDLPAIAEVGRKVWDSLFLTKQPIRLRISRLGDQSATISPPTPRASVETSPAIQDLITQIQAATRNVQNTEPQELKDLRLGRHKIAGSYGQYFGTWEFAFSMLRDYAMYTIYPCAKLARNSSLEIDHLTQVFNEFHLTYANFLGFCGLRNLQNYIQTLRALLAKKACTKQEFGLVMDALCVYTNLLTSWAYFYYPWSVGVFYRFAEED